MTVVALNPVYSSTKPNVTGSLYLSGLNRTVLFVGFFLEFSVSGIKFSVAKLKQLTCSSVLNIETVQFVLICSAKCNDTVAGQQHNASNTTILF